MRRAALLAHGPLSRMGGTERFTNYLRAFLGQKGFAVEVHEPRALSGRAGRLLQPLHQCFAVGRGLARRLDDYSLIVTVGYTAGHLRGPNVTNVAFGSMASYFRAIRRAPGFRRRLAVTAAIMIVCDRRSKRGKLCIATSAQVRDELKRDYGVPSVVVPCGIDTAHFARRPDGREFRSRHGIAPSALVGVFAGRWDGAHKGLDVLARVMRERSDVHWLVAGTAGVDLPGVARLTVLGEVGYADLPALYSAADFGVQLSRYESVGFTFLESLACGLPVISTPVGVAPEVYDDPVLGDLLVPLDPVTQPAEVDDRIDRLSDTAWREEVGLRSRARVEKAFSLEDWRERIGEVFRAVTERRSCAS